MDENGKNAIIIILSMTTIILFVLAVLLIVYNVSLSTSLIKPSDCPKINNDEFIIIPSQQVLVQNTCGNDQLSACVFNVDNVQDAIDKCNLYNCKNFIYIEATKAMSIVSDNYTAGGIYDVYSRKPLT